MLSTYYGRKARRVKDQLPCFFKKEEQQEKSLLAISCYSCPLFYPGQFLVRSICPHCCGPDWQRLARWQKSFSSLLTGCLSSLSRYLHLSCFRSPAFLWDRTVYLMWRTEKRTEKRTHEWILIGSPNLLWSLWSLWSKYLIFRLFRFRQVKPREISLSSLTVFIYSVQYFHKKISFSIIL